MTGRIKSLLLMLFAVVAAIALGAPGMASASPPLSKEAPGFTPNIVVPSPGDPPPPPPPPVPFLRSSLVITVAFKGGNGTPASFPDQTEAAINDQIHYDLNPWFVKVSHGYFGGYSRGTTHQYVTVQPTAPVCSDVWMNEVTDQAKAAERLMGTDPSIYDTVVYYFAKIPACPWGGKGAFPEGQRRVFLNGEIGLGVLAHEFGHRLGLGHAGSQACVDNFGTPVPLYGPLESRCTQREYGDAFSAMGGGSGGEPKSYSAAQLAQLGWIPGRVTTISAGDPTVTKVLSRLEDNVPGSTEALRLVDGITTLWVEYRMNDTIHGGLFVRAEQTSLAGAGHVAPFLLDMTPLDGDAGRPDGASLNADLPVGHAWTNPLGNMTITLNSDNGFDASVTIQSTPGPVPGPPPGPGPGPGPTTVAVPDVTSETIPSATSEITAAGLVRGAIRTTINCEDINRVVSQSPVAGVHLPPGGTVDLTQGIPRPGGCGTPQ